jgi:thioredoxin 1
MIQHAGFTTFCRRLSILVVAILFFGVVSCDNNTNKQPQARSADSIIRTINNEAEFKKIIETSGDRLLMLEFYADWCAPCVQLAPVLEKIARENLRSVTVYKINIDKNKRLASSFRVRGIPHISFVKNKETVLSLTGLYPKKMYLKAIERFSGTADS